MPVAVYAESQIRYQDLPPDIRRKYPPTKAKYGGDAIAEREGLLVPSKSSINGYRCAATSKGSGTRCGRVAVSGSLLCRSHGGTQARGIASPQYRSGARSQVLPLRLQAQYQAAIQDPDLLSLRQDLGVLELRVTQLLQGLETPESEAAWHQVQQLSQRLDQALEAKQGHLLPGLLGQLRDLVQGAEATQATWGELRGLLRDRAQLAALEHKRLQDLQGTVPVEALLAVLGHLLQQLQGILLANLDPHLARGILGQFQQEILALQSQGIPGTKGHPKPVTAPRILEPGTRRTVGYVPIRDRDQEPGHSQDREA